jgi:glycosyltransferase involved in cell wall biosynthesis
MRILLLNTSFRIEGPNRTFHEIAKNLPAMGFEILAGALAGRGPMEGVYRKLGIRTVYFGRPGITGITSLGSRLARFLDENAIDVVHCQLLRGELVAAMATRGRRHTALLCTVQNEDPYRKIRHNPPKAILSRWALGRADGVVVVSRALAEFVTAYQGVRATKIEVIHNAVDPALYMTRGAVKRPHDLPQSDLLIGCVGRFARQKGQEFLIQAFHEAKRICQSSALVLIGDGPTRRRLQRLARSREADRPVVFMGWKRAVNRYLPFFDIYVQPSRWEGLPFATMEAMASGVPVVATRVGGIPELVEEQREGLLVPFGDTRALREAIERLQSDDTLRKQLSREARRRIHKQFCADQMAAAYGRLYMRIGNRRPRS